MFDLDGCLPEGPAKNTVEVVTNLVTDRMVGLYDSGASVVEIKAYMTEVVGSLTASLYGVLQKLEDEGEVGLFAPPQGEED